MSNEYEAYVELLNSNPENQQLFETITISHSLFSQVYYLVFDSVNFIANDANGVSRTFIPANINSTNASNNNDLDQQASFTIGDLENILDDELDNLPLGNDEAPICTYAIYTSQYLDPADSIEYIISSVSQKDGAFTIQCGAPRLNSDETGEVFDYDRFPSLRGL